MPNRAIQKPGQAGSGFRADIEGLRGLAVVLVVAYHVDTTGLAGGFVGVDIFFVISGYLISGLLFEEYAERGRVDYWSFYARRARRLLPAALLMIASTLLVANALLSPLESTALAIDGLSAALSFSNVWFALNASQYFGAEVSHSPLLHTWSLAVEEQFYLVWPALLVLLLRLSPSKRSLIVALGLISALSFAGCVVMTGIQQTWAFYAMPFRMWEFGAGAVVYLLRPCARGTGPTASWFGILAVLASSVFLDGNMAFPGFVAVVPVVGTCLILYGIGAAPSCAPALFLTSRPMRVLGRLSYSWYLWHWPFLIFGRVLLPDHMEPYGSAVLVMIALAVAWAGQKLVEDPIRWHPRLVGNNALSLAFATAIICGATLSTLVAHAAATRAMHTPAQMAIQRAGQDRLEPGCKADFLETRLRECTYGPAEAGVVIALFGDSHAHQWLPALRQIAGRRGWRVVTFLKSSCPTAETRIYNAKLKRRYDECDVWRNSAVKRIRELRPDLVVMANSTSGYVPRPPKGRALTYQEWEIALGKMVGGFAATGHSVLLVRDNPRMPIDPRTCLSRAVKRGAPMDNSCVVERTLALDEEVFKIERTVLDKFENAHLLDLTDRLCDDLTCSAYDAGTIIYRDTNHLTRQVVLALAPDLDRAVMAIVGDRSGPVVERQF